MIKKILVLFPIFIIFSPIYAQNYSDGQYIATTEIRINHHFCPASMKSKIRFKINGNKVIGRISSKDKDEYNNKCCLMSLNRGFFGTLSSNGYLQTSSNRNSCSDWAKITGYIKNELFLTMMLIASMNTVKHHNLSCEESFFENFAKKEKTFTFKIIMVLLIFNVIPW